MGMIDAAGQMASAFAENLPSIIEQGLPLVELTETYVPTPENWLMAALI